MLPCFQLGCSLSSFSIVQQAALQNADVCCPSFSCCLNLERNSWYRKLKTIGQRIFNLSRLNKEIKYHQVSLDKRDIKTKSELKEDLLLHSSFVTCMALFIVCLFSGELHEGATFFVSHHSPVSLISKQIVTLLLLTIGQRQLLNLSQVYGAILVQILCTVRKVFSFIVSMVLFPKNANAGHLFGVLDVAIAAFLLQRHLTQKKKERKASHNGERVALNENHSL